MLPTNSVPSGHPSRSAAPPSTSALARSLPAPASPPLPRDSSKPRRGEREEAAQGQAFTADAVVKSPDLPWFTPSGSQQAPSIAEQRAAFRIKINAFFNVKRIPGGGTLAELMRREVGQSLNTQADVMQREGLLSRAARGLAGRAVQGESDVTYRPVMLPATADDAIARTVPGVYLIHERGNDSPVLAYIPGRRGGLREFGSVNDALLALPSLIKSSRAWETLMDLLGADDRRRLEDALTNETLSAGAESTTRLTTAIQEDLCSAWETRSLDEDPWLTPDQVLDVGISQAAADLSAARQQRKDVQQQIQFELFGTRDPAVVDRLQGMLESMGALEADLDTAFRPKNFVQFGSDLVRKSLEPVVGVGIDPTTVQIRWTHRSVTPHVVSPIKGGAVQTSSLQEGRSTLLEFVAMRRMDELDPASIDQMQLSDADGNTIAVDRRALMKALTLLNGTQLQQAYIDHVNQSMNPAPDPSNPRHVESLRKKASQLMRDTLQFSAEVAKASNSISADDMDTIQAALNGPTDAEGYRLRRDGKRVGAYLFSLEGHPAGDVIEFRIEGEARRILYTPNHPAGPAHAFQAHASAQIQQGIIKQQLATLKGIDPDNIDLAALDDTARYWLAQFAGDPGQTVRRLQDLASARNNQIAADFPMLKSADLATDIMKTRQAHLVRQAQDMTSDRWRKLAAALPTPGDALLYAAALMPGNIGVLAAVVGVARQAFAAVGNLLTGNEGAAGQHAKAALWELGAGVLPVPGLRLFRGWGDRIVRSVQRRFASPGRTLTGARIQPLVGATTSPLRPAAVKAQPGLLWDPATRQFAGRFDDGQTYRLAKDIESGQWHVLDPAASRSASSLAASMPARWDAQRGVWTVSPLERPPHWTFDVVGSQVPASWRVSVANADRLEPVIGAPGRFKVPGQQTWYQKIDGFYYLSDVRNGRVVIYRKGHPTHVRDIAIRDGRPVAMPMGIGRGGAPKSLPPFIERFKRSPLYAGMTDDQLARYCEAILSIRPTLLDQLDAFQAGFAASTAPMDSTLLLHHKRALDRSAVGNAMQMNLINVARREPGAPPQVMVAVPGPPRPPSRPAASAQAGARASARPMADVEAHFASLRKEVSVAELRGKGVTHLYHYAPASTIAKVRGNPGELLNVSGKNPGGGSSTGVYRNAIYATDKPPGSTPMAELGKSLFGAFNYPMSKQARDAHHVSRVGGFIKIDLATLPKGTRVFRETKEGTVFYSFELPGGGGLPMRTAGQPGADKGYALVEFGKNTEPLNTPQKRPSLPDTTSPTAQAKRPSLSGLPHS